MVRLRPLAHVRVVGRRARFGCATIALPRAVAVLPRPSPQPLLARTLRPLRRLDAFLPPILRRFLSPPSGCRFSMGGVDGVRFIGTSRLPPPASGHLGGGRPLLSRLAQHLFTCSLTRCPASDAFWADLAKPCQLPENFGQMWPILANIDQVVAEATALGAFALFC